MNKKTIIIFPIDLNQNHKEQSSYCLQRLRGLCKDEYGYEFKDEDILKNEHGKPYFANSELHFNISHSKGMGAVIVDKIPCGIDIEMLRDINYKIAERFFAEDEKEWISQAVGDEKIERFFKVWTGKEAYTKMLGCGLTIEIKSFSVLEKEIYSKLEYIREKNYIVCVCRK